MMNTWIQKAKSWFTPPRQLSLPKEKSSHDLTAMLQEINEVYFERQFPLKIYWYGKGITTARTKIRLGYYNPTNQAIGINRLLDTPLTPKYFLYYLIYHEMLHHVFPPVLGPSGRRKIHHKEFQEKEQLFTEYQEAQEFLHSFRKSSVWRKSRKW